MTLLHSVCEIISPLFHRISKPFKVYNSLSPFHISPAAAVHLSTNTLLGYFLRQPQDHLTFRKAARLSQRRTENFQQVHFPCVFRPMFGGRKAAARQPRDDRTVDVRIRTK